MYTGGPHNVFMHKAEVYCNEDMFVCWVKRAFYVSFFEYFACCASPQTIIHSLHVRNEHTFFDVFMQPSGLQKRHAVRTVAAVFP